MSEDIKLAFESRYNVRLGERLGHGHDGEILYSDRNTAVKLFLALSPFSRERQVYEVLASLQIQSIGGHAVPQLILADDALLAIEMTVVKPPFLLDFAGARLPSEVPDFPPEVWDEWHERKSEEFGLRWADAHVVRSEFERLTGYTLLDVHRGNIRFGDEDEG